MICAALDMLRYVRYVTDMHGYIDMTTVRRDMFDMLPAKTIRTICVDMITKMLLICFDMQSRAVFRQAHTCLFRHGQASGMRVI